MRILPLLLLPATLALATVIGIPAGSDATSKDAGAGANIETRDRWARAKLNQYKGLNCESDTQIEKVHNPKPGRCIDIHSSAQSIWLSRGAGGFFRRKMTAYAKTSCPADARIDVIREKQGGMPADRNCINIDLVFKGAPGAAANNGRIMSIRFETIKPGEDW